MKSGLEVANYKTIKKIKKEGWVTSYSFKYNFNSSRQKKSK